MGKKKCRACGKVDCKRQGGGWNYRMIRHLETDGSFYFQIHEVYYDKKGKPHMWSADPVMPGGCTPVELGSDASLMFGAVTRPAFEVKSDEKGNEKLVEVEVDMATGKNRAPIKN